MDSSKKKIYFASDAHLGLEVYEDRFTAERRIVQWMDSIKPTCKALYFVGDMFDYWFEYKYVIPKGFVRFIGKMAEFIDDGIPVYLYTGNHDVWMFGYFQEEIGATVYTKETILTLEGKNFYVAHGDGLGDPSLSFRFMRGFFRNKFCQFLYKWIHPDLTMPFGRAWSKSNRKKKRGNAAESYLGEEKEFLVQFAKKHSQTNDIDFYVFGHRHIVLDLTIEGNKRVIILGDWITNFTYAEWDGEHFEIKRYEEKQ
jgi:UDP-2,3-diacylglucosamine hydrolase